VGARIAPFPSISHEEVVERALARKKPFATSGTGYRDFLIRRTVVAEAATGHFEVVFISFDHPKLLRKNSSNRSLRSRQFRAGSNRIWES
jgi:hypothetical protein